MEREQGTGELSDDAADKLLASMACNNKIKRLKVSAKFAAQCRNWYSGLSDSDQTLVLTIWHTLQYGDEALALRVAAMLPPAPRRPDSTAGR
jgi:hypothetical protein